MAIEINTQVRLKTAPDKVGRYTGKSRDRGRGRRMLQIDFKNDLRYVLESALEIIDHDPDIYELISSGHFGGVINMRSTITHTRLTGRLADVIYSMEASNTEFYPYQFKPVLNFLDSPSQGILIADEVGLGKTIEAGLIWTELRARMDADRLLIICPAVLCEKWQEELAYRFGVRAEIYTASGLTDLLGRYRKGSINGFSAIVSIQGARPSRGWDSDPDKNTGSAQLARYLSENEFGDPLFDCVVVDEAHYLRNPGTQTHKLGQLARSVASYMVLLSATPIQLKSDDLFHLLSVIDSENFAYVESFRSVLEANQPLVNLASLIRRKGLTRLELAEGLSKCLDHPLLADNRQLAYLRDKLPSDEMLKSPSVAEKYASRVERVNLLARVVNRTRKVEVQVNRVVRDPHARAVQMNGMEEEFYLNATEIVRDYCIDNDLHAPFILTVPQRQMCSSIPAALRAWKKKQAQLDEVSLYEVGGDGVKDKKVEIGPLIEILARSVNEIGSYEVLKKGDSKYAVLIDLLTKYWAQYPDKKIILFSYYRETLHYLNERLGEDGFKPLLLMGGMSRSKHDVINDFKSSRAYKILIASEVASEGVDLQFSSVLINYDLPWNPMRVEQRIGRIDRIGQKEERILIQNFFYADTLDERIYRRLYERLDIFRYALGDIEEILGEKLKELSIYLLSHKLTPEQESARIDQTQLAVARNDREQKELEEEAAHLAAHGDYILNQVTAAREMRRYIDGRSLWVYVRDVLKSQFPGTELIKVEEEPLTVEIGLSQDARVEFKHYLDRAKSSAKTRLINHTYERVPCVFSNHVDFSSRQHEVINQTHPLIRFIASRIELKSFHPLVAAQLNAFEAGDNFKGDYLVMAQIWSTKGARVVEKLVFKGVSLVDGVRLTEDESEQLLNRALDKGDDWFAAKITIDHNALTEHYDDLLDTFDDEFEDHAMLMKNENEDRIDQMILSVQRNLDKIINTRENAVAGLRGRIAATSDMARKKNLESLITAQRSHITKGKIEAEDKIAGFEKQREISTEAKDVTAVVIHVDG